jgi:2,4-dienoyl-CoA reductase [(3E)-enoyl-CoA-producing], peroxisomal
MLIFEGTGPSGRIIFISSTLQYTGVQLNTHGVVAKAGIDALAAQLAIELGPRGLTSNVIAPGPIGGTEGMSRLVETGEQRDPSRAIPLQRLGLVKDIADATVYLLSDAGNYVNGATIVGKWQTPFHTHTYFGLGLCR